MVERLVGEELLQVFLASENMLQHSQKAAVLPLATLVMAAFTVELVSTCNSHLCWQQEELFLWLFMNAFTSSSVKMY